MKKNNLVSIIIPCYNQAQYLEEAVQSAVDQIYPNIEIIIVNDGSLDNTEELASKLQNKYPEIIHILTQNNSGLSEARNSGIKEAVGDYILPLDADDSIDKSMISKCMEEMINTDADIVYTDIKCFGTQNNIFIQKATNVSDILYRNYPSSSSLYKRKVWKKCDGYKRNMKDGYEDWEFWVNAFRNNFVFQYIPKAYFYYRVKAESRDVSAQKLDKYLTSKLMLNNSTIYTLKKVKNAISTIKLEEELADFYFYSNNKILENEEELILTVGSFISANTLHQKQSIAIRNKCNIGICPLNILENIKNIEELHHEMHVKLILFYAPIRYKISSLYCSNFSWDTHRGIVRTEGTIFPYTIHSKLRHVEFQSIAYEYMENYVEHTIEKKDNTIHELRETNHKLRETNNLICTSIKDLAEISILFHPNKKYNAYKNLLNTYYKVGKKCVK